MTVMRIARFALVSSLALTTVAGARVGQRSAAGEEQVVEITAERFSFTPSEIRAKTGITLKISLQSDDTAHGFRILGTNVDVELPKRGRGVASVSFTPDKAGTYTFECSRVCGAGHAFMRGVIVVAD